MGEREKLIKAFKSRANEWDSYDFDRDWDYSTESEILADIALGVFEKAHTEPSDAQVDESIVRAFAESDDRNHEDLCSCGTWPDTCVTYGDHKPWSHDAEFVARAALRAAREVADG